MTLFRDGRFVDDDWQFVPDGEPMPAAGRVAVPKARWLAERAALRAREGGIGITLAAADTLAGIEDDIRRFKLITIDFPRFTDGRAYSLARRLRDQHAYTGELRAVGDVLQDQLMFMIRSGFDAFEIVHPGTLAALREGRVVAVRHHFQPASDDHDETRDPGAAWRRLTVRRSITTV
jgi:uncharacterized protein (DUF934 family)